MMYKNILLNKQKYEQYVSQGKLINTFGIHDIRLY